MPPVSQGTSESPFGRHGDGGGEDRWLLRFEPHLPYAYEALWPALSTADGLRGWLAAADVLQRRLGGAVTLCWLNTGTSVTGRITAWDTERVVEYTVSEQGRIRFHLEPVGTDSTVLRFVNERGGTEAERLDCLAGWHHHFELLESALAGTPAGTPADRPLWNDARWAELRGAYAAAAGAAASRA
ncbi:SRPBCC domain-containing protein [Streptomyces sp. NPDC060031]|uniref:SRPBCC domain-containing protein n=1 Tax=Streptomyces sp. NPDC060031 TaxID=3347043 RepID=UPI0036B65BFE